MSEFEKSKAAFDYMLLHTDIGEPVLSDLWRIHGGREEAIPFLEQRALSPLRFGIGMCEDYAAALTLLLREMGLQALYVPGLTYSAEGHLVDHAWTMVQIDGIWYHLDSQLEDSISRHGMIRYKYFLRGDATLSSSQSNPILTIISLTFLYTSSSSIVNTFLSSMTIFPSIITVSTSEPFAE